MDEGGATGDGVGDVERDFLGGAFVDEGAVGSATFGIRVLVSSPRGTRDGGRERERH